MFWYSQRNGARIFTVLSSCQVARQHLADIYIQFHIHIRIRWLACRAALDTARRQAVELVTYTSSMLTYFFKYKLLYLPL